MLVVRHYGPVNWRGLAILYRRGVERYLSQWVESLAGPVATSLLFLAVFVLARGGGSQGLWPGVDSASFVGAGIVIFSACHSAFETLAVNILYDKMEGMLKDLLASPLTALETLVGWIASAITNGCITATAVGLAMLPFVEWRLALPVNLIGFALLATLLFGLMGLLVGLWASKWDHFAMAETFLILPLALLSGTFYLQRDLPPLGAAVLDANPVFYAFDGFRSGLLGRMDSDPTVGWLYLGGLCLALGILAWRLVSTGWRLKD